MFLKQSEITPAVTLGVSNLRAYLVRRLALPRHFQRGKAPPGMSRDTLIARRVALEGEVAVGMASNAGIARDAGPCRPTRDRRAMDMLITALKRCVGRRMAIHASGFISTFAASAKSARERAWGSWMLENSEGARSRAVY